MGNKRIILLIGLLLIASGLIGTFLIEREVQTNKKETGSYQNSNKIIETKVSDSNVSANNTVQADLYTNSSYYIPFSSVVEVAKTSEKAKQKINEILELAQGCYFIKYNPENHSTLILLQNPANDDGNKYIRHNLQLVKIDNSGETSYSDIGYTGQENEVENAVLKQKNEDWEFDETVEPFRPLKHTVYDKKKKISYTEIWNYDDSNDIKYEMKNSQGCVISDLKETMTGESNFRQEHIFYDDAGNIKKTVTTNYDGADLKWFTYFDSEKPENNITIESVYDNGLKVGEKIYNQEYKIVETIDASYTDGERTKLKISDSDGKEVVNILKTTE